MLVFKISQKVVNFLKLQGGGVTDLTQEEGMTLLFSSQGILSSANNGVQFQKGSQGISSFNLSAQQVCSENRNTYARGHGTREHRGRVQESEEGDECSEPCLLDIT